MVKHKIPMNRSLLGVAVLILYLTAAPCSAQEAAKLDRSLVPDQASNPSGFVPRGWKIEQQLSADLDGDSTPDFVLKLVEDKPEKNAEGNATERGRALVVALQKGEGKLMRAAVATDLLQCTLCGGAFYGVSEAPANISIEKNVIVVDQDHGSRDLTNTYYRFRYDPTSQKFVLIGFDYADADRLTANVVSESTNYLTGIRKTTRGKGGKDVSTSTRVPKKTIFLDDADSEKLEAEATKRLGLD